MLSNSVSTYNYFPTCVQKVGKTCDKALRQTATLVRKCALPILLALCVTNVTIMNWPSPPINNVSQYNLLSPISNASQPAITNSDGIDYDVEKYGNDGAKSNPIYLHMDKECEEKHLDFARKDAALANNSAILNPRFERIVSVALMGQLANQLFQIFAAWAKVQDLRGQGLNATLVISSKDLPRVGPGLRTFVSNMEKLKLSPLFKIVKELPKDSDTIVWEEPFIAFCSIPNPQAPHLRLVGYFQHRDFFQKYLNEINSFFSPTALADLNKKVRDAYPKIFDPNTTRVGIHVRTYLPMHEDTHYPSYCQDYYQKAIQYFPEDSTFFVSSNDQLFARHCLKRIKRKFIYINTNEPVESLYLLSLFENLILTNSMFSWAAVSMFPRPANQTIVVPKKWYLPPHPDDAWMRGRIPNDKAYIAIDAMRYGEEDFPPPGYDEKQWEYSQARLKRLATETLLRKNKAKTEQKK